MGTASTRYNGLDFTTFRFKVVFVATLSTTTPILDNVMFQNVGTSTLESRGNRCGDFLL